METYFYRFEFQNRGIVHVHLLVWLKDIRLPLLRGDIPWSDNNLAFQVSNLQKSDKACLELNQRPTDIITRDGMQVLRLHHPAEAFALNLRGYISSLVPSLKWRMDVQTSDGREMVLRYVASYVSKWQVSYQNDSLLQYLAFRIDPQRLQVERSIPSSTACFGLSKVFVCMMTCITISMKQIQEI